LLLRRNPRAEPLTTESNAARPTFRPPFAIRPQARADVAQPQRSRPPAGASSSRQLSFSVALASPNLEGEPGGETPAPGIAPPRGVSVRRIQSRTDRLSFSLSSSAPPWGDRRTPASGLSPPTSQHATDSAHAPDVVTAAGRTDLMESIVSRNAGSCKRRAPHRWATERERRRREAATISTSPAPPCAAPCGHTRSRRTRRRTLRRSPQ
jgi:hypothetical protein